MEQLGYYSYFRNGVELVTPSIDLAISRNDGKQQILFRPLDKNDSVKVIAVEN